MSVEKGTGNQINRLEIKNLALNRGKKSQDLSGFDVSKLLDLLDEKPNNDAILDELAHRLVTTKTIKVEEQEKVIYLFREASIQGNATGQKNLAYCYQEGIGVEKDAKEAVRLYRLAVEQGHAAAQCNLGLCYANGIGVEEDAIEAVRLYKLAAKQGDTVAQYHLSICYSHGAGVEKDAKEAVRWLRVAAGQRSAIAQLNLGFCYKYGIGVGKNATQALRWFILAAEQGNAIAQANLGMHYERGIGVKKDIKEAVHLYQLAAQQGNPIAQTNLGIYYENGIGVKKDIKEAVRLYKLAAEQGNARAQTNLGSCYGRGNGVEKDIKEAVRLHQLAADQGRAIAQNSLGRRYEMGIGVERDAKQAMRLYRLAAAKGNDNALKRLSMDSLQSYLKEVEVEDEEKLWGLVVSKAISASRDKTQIDEEIIYFLTQTPNKLRSGGYTEGPNKALEEKRSKFEKRVGKPDAQELFAYLNALFSKDALKIILAYGALTNSSERPWYSSLKNFITFSLSSSASSSSHPTSLPPEDKKSIPLTKEPSSSIDFFRRPVGEEKILASSKFLESNQFNLDTVLKTIKSTLQEIASSDEPFDVKGIETLKSKKTIADLREWFLNHLNLTQYKKLKEVLLDKAEEIPTDLEKNTFLKPQQLCVEVYKFLDQIDPFLGMHHSSMQH